MLHDKGIKEGRKQRYLLYTLTHTYKHIHNTIRRNTWDRLLISVSGHVVFITIFCYLFPLPSTSTSADALPAEVTQTLIPERSGPLVVLPGLDCYGFPLSLITAHGNRRYPKGSPVFHTLCYLHCGVGVQFPLVVKMSQRSNSFLCLVIQRYEDYKVAIQWS